MLGDAVAEREQAVELSGNVFFENVHFADSLLTLSYRITKHFSPGVKEPK